MWSGNIATLVLRIGQVTYVPQGSSKCARSQDHPRCREHSSRKTFSNVFICSRMAPHPAPVVFFFFYSFNSSSSSKSNPVLERKPKNPPDQLRSGPEVPQPAALHVTQGGTTERLQQLPVITRITASSVLSLVCLSSLLISFCLSLGRSPTAAWCGTGSFAPGLSSSCCLSCQFLLFFVPSLCLLHPSRQGLALVKTSASCTPPPGSSSSIAN